MSNVLSFFVALPLWCIVHFGATRSPHEIWAAQQLKKRQPVAGSFWQIRFAPAISKKSGYDGAVELTGVAGFSVRFRSRRYNRNSIRSGRHAVTAYEWV